MAQAASGVPRTTLIDPAALGRVLGNLHRWADRGIPAPVAARITVSDPTSASAVTSVDQYGNALGGAVGPRTTTRPLPAHVRIPEPEDVRLEGEVERCFPGRRRLADYG